MARRRNRNKAEKRKADSAKSTSVEPTPSKQAGSRSSDIALLVFLGTGCVAAFAVLIEHDYFQYVRHWLEVIERDSPWSGLIEGVENADPSGQVVDQNTYGPLHATFAIFILISKWFPSLAVIATRLPKLLFFVAWTVGAWYMLRTGRRMQSPWVDNTLWKWVVFANPAVIIFGALFGQHDTLLAVLCALAVVNWHQNRNVRGGLLLAIGIGIKFYPLILLGAAGPRARRGSIVFPLAVIGGIAAIFGVAWLIWGNDCFAPLMYATERPSKKLSIFRFLRGSYSPLKFFTETPNADHLSGISLLVSLVVVTIATWWYRWRIPFSCLLLSWCVVLFYKVGHMNLYFWTLPLAFYFVLNRPVDELTKNFVKAFTAFWGWLSLLAIIYFPTRLEGPFAELREWVSLPTFLLAIWVLVTLIKLSPAEREAVNDAP